MTVSASWALQQAIIAKLNGAQALTALLAAGHVHDRVPPRAPYPYLAYGPVRVKDWSTGSGPGAEQTVTLTAYSREPGFREAYQLVGLVTDQLDQASLTLSGHDLVLLRFDGSEFKRDPDGLTSRGAVTFKALTERAG